MEGWGGGVAACHFSSHAGLHTGVPLPCVQPRPVCAAPARVCSRGRPVCAAQARVCSRGPCVQPRAARVCSPGPCVQPRAARVCSPGPCVQPRAARVCSPGPCVARSWLPYSRRSRLPSLSWTPMGGFF
eukprot:SAG25_NODE_286_length_10355_cov_16.654544_4_plen_129_part_00